MSEVCGPLSELLKLTMINSVLYTLIVCFPALVSQNSAIPVRFRV